MRVRFVLLVLFWAVLGVAQDTSSKQQPHPESSPKTDPQAATSSENYEGATSRAESGEPMSSPCPGDVKVVKGEVTQGMLMHKVAPSYPAKARQAHIQGAVVMCALIEKDGKVTNLRPVSGPQELIPAAMKAVQRWRYRPYRVNNEPVVVKTLITVNFHLCSEC